MTQPGGSTSMEQGQRGQRVHVLVPGTEQNCATDLPGQ